MKLWFAASKVSSLTWIKASRSTGMGACVELATDGDLIAVRDSKNPSIELRYTHQELDAFIDGAKRGEFDHLLRRRE